MKVLKIALAAVAAAVLSSPASAVYIQQIDYFESGSLSLSKWSIDVNLNPDFDEDVYDYVDVYNAIVAPFGNGASLDTYYPPGGNWMMVMNAGNPITRVSTSFTSYSGGDLVMSVFFSALETYLPNFGPGWSYNDFAEVEIDGVRIFFMDTASTGIHGEGSDNTGWLSLSTSLAAGSHFLEFSVKNDGGDFNIDSQLAVDSIGVMYANGIPPELDDGGGVIPSIPEPSTVVLFSIGLIGLSVMRIRRRESLAASAWKPTELSVTRV